MKPEAYPKKTRNIMTDLRTLLLLLANVQLIFKDLEKGLTTRFCCSSYGLLKTCEDAGVPGLAYCLVGAGISSRSINDLTK